MRASWKRFARNPSRSSRAVPGPHHSVRARDGPPIRDHADTCSCATRYGSSRSVHRDTTAVPAHTAGSAPRTTDGREMHSEHLYGLSSTVIADGRQVQRRWGCRGTRAIRIQPKVGIAHAWPAVFRRSPRRLPKTQDGVDVGTFCSAVSRACANAPVLFTARVAPAWLLSRARSRGPRSTAFPS